MATAQPIKAITAIQFKDHAEAVANYRRLAVTGSPRAIGQLGCCIYHGFGNEKEDKLVGLLLMESAAELEDIFSQYVLGSMYLSGVHPKGKDVARGKALYERVRGNKDPQALNYYYGLINGIEYPED